MHHLNESLYYAKLLFKSCKYHPLNWMNLQGRGEGMGADHSSVEQREGGSKISRILEEHLEATKACSGPRRDGSLYVRFVCASLYPKYMQKSDSFPVIPANQEMNPSDVVAVHQEYL